MLAQIWYYLFHVHKWNIIEHGILNGNYGGKGDRYILQCDKCGILKKKDLI